jgi:hypothetical protein
MRGWCEKVGARRIGFGEVWAEVRQTFPMPHSSTHSFSYELAPNTRGASQ